ncbi:unnamed protein product [Zymoseptoria tritici ST99CH_1A5]|uniref:CCHC-type domain-containing protein n=2 Tax=Zymoseptoria tritici TaxID=1047171 RepID=A0A1X7S2A6_ZYMT9|nr:unnamed protein product [Zymoseptoria tritici ST99CH_3D7]SMY27217.1 unnamed protein product [Zymoseptoria tritici ST99CH_1A5]
MAAPGGKPKIMSSRLAGMKFMQRGSVSSPPSTPAEPPAKKQRMSNGGFTSSPAPSPRTDNEIMEQAAAAQEQKRAAAIEQEGVSKGETKWYLSFKAPQTPAVESPLRIVSAGYSALDAVDRRAAQNSDSEDDESAKKNMPGRKSFGKFGRGPAKKDDANADLSDPDDNDEDEEEEGELDDEDDPTGVKSLINQGRKEATERLRAERKEKKRAEQADALRIAKQRREKEIDLNNVTSISGGGGSKGSPLANMTCHQCSGKGHMARDCPQKKQNRPSKLRKSY